MLTDSFNRPNVALVTGRIFNIYLDFLAYIFGNLLFVSSLPLILARRLFPRGKIDDIGRKIVVVSHADSSLGRVVVMELLRLGFVVVAGCHDDKINKSHFLKVKEDRLHVFGLNLAKQHQIDGLVKFLDRFEGARLWAIVNLNSSIENFGPLELISDENLHSIVDSNLGGKLRIIKSLLPLIRRQDKARIINVNSNLNSSTILSRIVNAAELELSNEIGRELASFDNVDVVGIKAEGDYNADHVINAFNRSIERARPEVIEAYGGLDGIEQIRKSILNQKPGDQSKLVRAILDATMSFKPKTEYNLLSWKNRISNIFPRVY